MGVDDEAANRLIYSLINNASSSFSVCPDIHSPAVVLHVFIQQSGILPSHLSISDMHLDEGLNF